MIEIKGLYFNIGDVKILKDLRLKIEDGFFYTIIGPNGSGKTTLLKHLARILMPEGNILFVRGKDIVEYKGREFGKIISYVPQEIDRDLNFSAFDIVLMGRFPHLKRFENERQIDVDIALWAMKVTNTLHLKDKNLSNLSGGEKQRVIIARALAQQGKILILDEPTSHLDINHQIEIMDMLKELNEKYGITILCVLHDLNIAAQFSDIILVMNKGKIEALGNPKDILNEELIKKVYGVNVHILKNSQDQKPFIIPISRKYK